MPYVNCPECGIRSFALAPWSAVGCCPACEAPLKVPRLSVPQDKRIPRHWTTSASIDQARPSLGEAQGAR